jgi:hypothetical protein
VYHKPPHPPLPPLKCFFLQAWVENTYSNRMTHLLTFADFIRLRIQDDMISKAFNNIVTLKKDQSILNGLFLELVDEKVLDSRLFVLDFELH